MVEEGGGERRRETQRGRIEEKEKSKVLLLGEKKKVSLPLSNRPRWGKKGKGKRKGRERGKTKGKERRILARKSGNPTALKIEVRSKKKKKSAEQKRTKAVRRGKKRGKNEEGPTFLFKLGTKGGEGREEEKVGVAVYFFL